jgi:hypothetical protein
MHFEWHLLVSLAIAAVSLFFSQNVPFLTIDLLGYNITVFILCLAFGVFVDFDHVVDFLLNGKYAYESNESRYRKGRMFVVFHGIENAIILGGLSIVCSSIIYPAISYFFHIIMDVFGNGVSFEAYFYTVRFGRRILHSKSTVSVLRAPP